MGEHQRSPFDAPQESRHELTAKGWAAEFVLDKQTLSDVGNNVWLQSPGFDPTAPYYDSEVASSARMVTITSG